MISLKDVFTLTWKKIYFLVVGGFLAVILHNLFYALFGFEEAFFFILVVFVLPAYLLVSLVYTFIKKIGGKK